MNKSEKIIDDLLSGAIDRQEAIDQLQPLADLGFAQLDLNRSHRLGYPEVIFGEGKTKEQLVAIISLLIEKETSLLVTRVAASKATFVLQSIPHVAFHEKAGILCWRKNEVKRQQTDPVTIITAGTSDQKIAEEAAVTIEHFGFPLQRFYDIGVAGLHRLIDKLPDIRNSSVIIVVAGMDGVLPSLVGGLVNRPIIAVPTHIGYGANFQGLAPLLTMLNSCAPGVTVVNIDNGFGAAYAAIRIIKKK